MCDFTTRGTFCSRPCQSCERRMKWRQIDAKLAARRSNARTMTARPGGSK